MCHLDVIFLMKAMLQLLYKTKHFEMRPSEPYINMVVHVK